MSFSVPRVCDACKETEENDNEIVENLCKNDFGKSTSFTETSVLKVKHSCGGPRSHQTVKAKS